MEGMDLTDTEEEGSVASRGLEVEDSGPVGSGFRKRAPCVLEGLRVYGV